MGGIDEPLAEWERLLLGQERVPASALREGDKVELVRRRPEPGRPTVQHVTVRRGHAFPEKLFTYRDTDGSAVTGTDERTTAAFDIWRRVSAATPTYKEGDVITATHADGRSVTGPLTPTTNGARLVIRFDSSVAVRLDDLIRDGWAIGRTATAKAVNLTPNPAPATKKEAAPMAEKLTPVTRLTIKTGDTIVAKRANGNTIRGTVAYDSLNARTYLPIGGVKLAISGLYYDGYDFERVDKVPTLPVEGGHYTDKDGRPWLLAAPNYGKGGQPWTAWDGIQHTPASAESFGPFKRIGTAGF